MRKFTTCPAANCHASLPREDRPHVSAHRAAKTGKVLVLLAVMLPVIVGFIGLVIDTSFLLAEHRDLQHAADAAATAAARAVAIGASTQQASDVAAEYVQQRNGFATAAVDVNVPPTTGRYVGDSNFVEVVLEQECPTYFVHILGTEHLQTVRTRAVAGLKAATTGSAIVVLDSEPPPIDVSATVPLPLTIPPVHLGGLEVLGLGALKVDGAVLVNTEWGGVDQDGNAAGLNDGPPYGVSCTPILPLSSLRARDIRVTGGVDNVDHYDHFLQGEPTPLQANRLPVADPFTSLPVPTTSVDSSNVSTEVHGGVSVTGLPLIGPPVTLDPGVYDWIEVLSGIAVFNPGVYIIRGKHPVTQLSLSVVAGKVTAEGVMFYITDSASYSPASGSPDNSDGEDEPDPLTIFTLVPSVVINSALLGSNFSPLDDAGSPFDGMLIYQRRTDRRPIVLAGVDLLGGGMLEGTVYSKWGEVIFVGKGSYDMRFVAGSIRFANLLECTIAPQDLLPPAYDVFLVE